MTRDFNYHENEMDFRRNIEDVRARIEIACRKTDRDPAGVELVGVTKYATMEQAQGLVTAGLKDVGENRAHEGGKKRKGITGEARWHMIGHLQTNKAKLALEWMDVLHSLDRISLAAKLETALSADNLKLPAYVQVNISGEGQKGGFAPSEVEAAVEEIRTNCPHLELQGLMTMAPYDASEEVTRPIFRTLRERAEACGLSGLSMGMSGDFETAVEEGATVVRVGSALLRG